MQFSLRTLLFFSIAISIGIIGYITKRQGEVGVEIKISHPQNKSFPFQSDRPDSVREYWDYRKVREHDLQSKADPQMVRQNRLETLTKDLSIFNQRYEVDKTLLNHEERPLFAIAKARLNDATPFKQAVKAAWILNYNGDSNAFDWIVIRFNQDRPADSADRKTIFNQFDRKRLILNEGILETLYANVDQDNSMGSAARYVFFSTGHDKQPLVDWNIEQTKSDRHKTKQQAFRWLLDNAPSVEVLESLEEYLLRPMMGNEHLARTLLSQNFNDHPELKLISDRIERKLGEQFRKFGSKDSIDSTMLMWNVIAQRGTDVSKPLYVHMLSKDKRFHFSAATALKRLGHEDELIELLLNMTKSAVPLGPTGTIAEKPPEHKEKFADLASFKVLTDIFWDSGHQAVIDLIREKIYCDGKGWYWLAALLMLEQVGDPDVAELWRKLSLADLESPQTRFLHNWYAKGLSRNKLTQWINRRLQKPADKLSIKKIVSMPRYHSEDYMWKNDQRDIQSHFHFALFALAASGQGVFTDGDNYNLPTYNDLLVEMVPDYDKDFRITSHSSESKSEYDLKIVINNRLYRYSRSLNVPDWNHSYEVRAAAEMLNTIASRFGNKKRFFVYETGMGYDFRLVLYVEPVVAKELADKFTIIPVESSKLWMLEED